ncbi:hypothetical protein Mal4_29370 [Maioricimonas rarisocia]|uniref:Uncharacterized protein n=1 Tax=Maioricimonas rarisocia TaxID=2528026 RepID=A0A517Z7Z9_9PLAN|nr:hypothetical protein [Maioricimonas rarisocia]QDU38608.1 hypothetical protein Mal4_29370 [Maioricimonas rarisocia]
MSGKSRSWRNVQRCRAALPLSGPNTLRQLMGPLLVVLLPLLLTFTLLAIVEFDGDDGTDTVASDGPSPSISARSD